MWEPSWSKGRTAGNIFGREPSNDYFIKILFLLSKWFQTRRFSWEFPTGSYVKLSSAVAAILVGGLKCQTQVWKGTTQGSFQQIFGWDWLSSFRGEDCFLISSPLFLFLAWWPSWLEVRITGHNFGRGLPKDHSTKVWLQLAQWFLRRRLKCEMLTDGQRTKSDGNSSHGLKARWAKKGQKTFSLLILNLCIINMLTLYCTLEHIFPLTFVPVLLRLDSPVNTSLGTSELMFQWELLITILLLCNDIV